MTNKIKEELNEEALMVSENHLSGTLRSIGDGMIATEANHIERKFKTIAKFLSAIVFFMGISVLVGWILDIGALKSIFPSMVSMKANTSICFILIGASLSFYQWMSPKSGLRRILVRSCAFLILLTTMMTLSEYMFGWNLGIDQLLFKELGSSILTSSPGRMALNTAICFGMTGMALFFLETKTMIHIWFIHVSAVMIGFFALFSLVGYVYHATPLIMGNKFSTAMALHTATGLILVSASILFSTSQGLMKTVVSQEMGGRMLRMIIPVAVCIPLILGWVKLELTNHANLNNEISVALVAFLNIVFASAYIFILSLFMDKEDIKQHQQERRLSTVVLDSNDAIILKDFDGQITTWNHGAELMYGYREKEALQMNIRRLTPPDKETEHTEFVRRLMAGETVSSFETQRVTKDGRILDVWLTVTKVLDDTGKPIGIASTERDITKRNRLEESLLRITKEWGETFDVINEAITIHDTEFNIIRTNKTAEKLLGKNAQEILSSKCFAVLHGEPSPPMFCPSCGSMKTGKPSVIEVFEPHLNKFLEIKALPRFDEKENIIGLVHVVNDITERKKMEEENEKNQKRLVQSEKMAAVGQLAAGVAHEINNPMTVILGFSQSLAEKIKSGDVFELPVKSIEREALRCNNFVKTLLAFSRTSASDQTLIDINLKIKEIIPLLEARAKMVQVEIIKELSEGLPKILGNPIQIQQVIVNLANNAFDAMEKGGLLTLKTELLIEEAQSWVCLKVSDTGSGIPPEILAKIFEPFFTTKEVGKGTGLGLSLVHDMVEKNSGTIEVQSRSECTEFTVKFQCPHN